MQGFGTGLMRRVFQRRYGIAVRRVGVRNELRWYWRAGIWVLVLSLSLAAGGWIYDAGRRFAGYDRQESERELAELRLKLGQSEQQLQKLNESVRAAEAKLQVEAAALLQMTAQLKAGQRDNLALKEELALFEGLVSGASPLNGVVLRVPKVQLEHMGQGHYRYRMLVVHQSSQKSARDFEGEFWFELKVRSEGHDAMMSVPVTATGSVAPIRITVRHIHRVEGEFSLPLQTTVVGGEVLLSQGGGVKLRQLISI